MNRKTIYGTQWIGNSDCDESSKSEKDFIQFNKENAKNYYEDPDVGSNEEV